VYALNSNQEIQNPLQKYIQGERLALCVSGNRTPESWMFKQEPVSFYYLKRNVENVMERLGIVMEKVNYRYISDELFAEALVMEYNKMDVAVLGLVNRKIRKQFELKQEVYFAEINWDKLLKAVRNVKVEFKELAKFPEVRRDLSLLLQNNVSFDELKQEALRTERKLLKDVSLFDVYEGKNLGEGKKSYALSFILQDETNTLTDKQIDKIMNNIIRNFDQNFAATLR
jgi:phenylalanyl-tRNA synthetase beta chain